MHVDYVIVGSGLAGLSFGALAAQAGKKVVVLEAHYLPGGYGHTFELGGYRFNAQLHYVWNCGEGRSVHQILKKLGLHQTITFEHYDPNGFDHMRMPGCALDIPYDYDLLSTRLQRLFPGHEENLRRFVVEIKELAEIVDHFPRFQPRKYKTYKLALRNLLWLPHYIRLIPYMRLTLQQVFDRFNLPPEAQTLLALQWPDFMLPPEELSFLAWLALFSGYCRGAYYPTHHFESVIDGFVGTIENNGGTVLLEHKVIEFIQSSGQVTGVVAERLAPEGGTIHITARDTICNMDPRRAAEMIGLEKFSAGVRKKLNYAYSPSNFMVYCAVEGLDLEDYGFGKWNLFHTEEPDLNKAYHRMYHLGDYSAPSFAVTVPGLLTNDGSDAPEGQQIMEFITVANYQRFWDLKASSPAAYRRKKREITDSMINVMERRYIPGLRDHITFLVSGSPTTNERYCWSPAGNSYGSNMIPENIGPGRLNHKTSLKNFYFCNASSGYAGFAGTIWTGANLYEILEQDAVFNP
jgi:phytoene dehydrogenase-like protein